MQIKNILIYLDNCCFNRPFDDQNYLSIYLETEAKLAIQNLIKNDKLKLAWSFILDYENESNPDEIVKKEIFSWRKLSSSMVYKSPHIIEDANKIISYGISNKDALHIASAIKGGADFFITVDKGIIKKKKLIKKIIILSPIDFVGIIEEVNNEI